MKTSRLLLVAGLILGTASLVTAGPGPQFWVRPAAPKPASAATTAAPAAQAPVAAACSNCGTCSCSRKG